MDMQRDTALLVIDVQQGLFERKTRVHNADQMLTNINRLIKKARLSDVLVIFVQHQNDNTLVRDSAAWQLHPRIQPLQDEMIIYKHHGDAFKDTQLKAELEERGVSELWITGLVSQGCVRATILGALERGFSVFLVSDAHSTFSKGAREIVERINLQFKRAGCKLVSTGQLIGED